MNWLHSLEQNKHINFDLTFQKLKLSLKFTDMPIIWL